MSSLLINECPLMFQPSLALKFGVNEAIFIQKLHYLQNPEFNKNVKEGRTWVYNTYSQWEEVFPFWGRNTIIRTIESCENQGAVISKTLFKNKSNRTKWYALNYQFLDSLNIGTYTQNEHSVLPKMGKRSTQNGQINHIPKMGKCNEQYITKEIIQENNTVELASNSTTAPEQPSVILEDKPTIPMPEPEPKEQSEPLAAEPVKQPKEKRNENYWKPVVLSIFAYWQTVLNHPKARLDANRGACITKALKLGFSEDDLKKAIDGLSKTPHNIGINDRGEVYDGLHIVFRSAEQIERFMRNADNPPKATLKLAHEQKKPSYSDKVQAANKAAGNIMEKFYPDLVKHFPMFAPESKPIDFNIPQLRQEIVVNAI